MVRRVRCIPPSAVAIALLAIAPIWPLLSHFLGRRTLVFSDIAALHHPLVHGAQGVAGGALWSDAIFCGYPLFADTQAAPYYPGTWLLQLFDHPRVFIAFVFVHLSIGAVGAFFWLAQHRFEWPARVVGAVTLAFGGFFVCEGNHLGMLAAMSWTPWLLGSATRVVERPTLSRIAVGAVVAYLLLAAGSPQMASLAALLATAYAMMLLLARWREGWRALSLRLAALAALTLFALGLGAIVILPATELLSLSQRSIGLDLNFASQRYIASSSLWQLLVHPRLQRPPTVANVNAATVELYVGLVGCMLATLGVFAAANARATGRALLFPLSFLVLAVLAIGAALGPTQLIYQAAIEHLPLLGLFRVPMRLFFLAQLAIAFLAAYGLSCWIRGQLGRRAVIVVFSAFALLLLLGGRAWLASFRLSFVTARPELSLLVMLLPLGAAAAFFAFRHQRRVAGLALAALVFVDLVILAAPRYPLMTNEDDHPSREQYHHGHLRGVAHVATIGRDQRPPPRLLIAPGFGHGSYNTTFLERVHGVSGYNASSLLRFLDLMHLINKGRFYPRSGLYKDEVSLKPERLWSPLVDMLAAPYVLTPNRPKAPHLKLIATFQAGHKTERLYHNTRAVPRVYLAYHTKVATSLAERQEALISLDPQQTALVESPMLKLDGPKHIEAARIVSQEPDRWLLEAAPTQHALLVIADSYYPGWRATVDGVDATIVPTNQIFRGIELSPGAHRIELRFEPASYRVGRSISLTTLVVLLLALGWRWHNARRRSPTLGKEVQLPTT
ncbi:MAG: hypothetical protein CSA65_09395 [Proteobacteria bacterium]|nr:MAG: hypothetical protein CSB49_07960 [Pseudomonadota bacterium]PIE17308.1 MAG: hypothetical protein CSA65_09395 [Pseudomonadota bacterium]